MRMTGSGTEVVVGPLKAEGFPYILLDRALGVVRSLMIRTHARRDTVKLDAKSLKAELDKVGASTEKWSQAKRKAAAKFISAVRRGKNPGSEFQPLLTVELERLASLKS